jgi:hypothetical protein
VSSRRSIASLAVALTLIALSGCKVPPPPKPLDIKTIAVLPFDNESNDLNAPDIMQLLVYKSLVGSIYQVSDIKETNAFLEKVGIVDGGQLAIVDPVKLGKDMGVQGLMFGYVEDFHYANVGYYLERKVTLQLRLVEVATGATLWSNRHTAATRLLTLDSKEAASAFGAGLADQFIDKLFKKPLQREAQEATIMTLRGLPGLTFAGVATNSGAQEQAERMFKEFFSKRK